MNEILSHFEDNQFNCTVNSSTVILSLTMVPCFFFSPQFPSLLVRLSPATHKLHLVTSDTQES